jgi:threonine/homoserine/homoserine lactone efflux protein
MPNKLLQTIARNHARSEQHIWESYISTQSNQSNNSRRSHLLVRWLTSLIALVMIGLGLWSIATHHYFGRTTQFGGAEISLEGHPATLIGLLYIVLGLLPLALWFRSPRAAVWCASVCAVAFLALLAAVLYG